MALMMFTEYTEERPMMRGYRFILRLVLLALLAHGAWPSDSAATAPSPQIAEKADEEDQRAQAPEQLVRKTVDKVLAILKKPEYQIQAKRAELREEIRQTLLKVVDIDRVATLTLANYKSRFSSPQLTQFVDSFSNPLFYTYISHIEKYTDEKIDILKTDEMRDNMATVRTKIIAQHSEVPVDYRMYKNNGKWKVYDIVIENVSLVQNYRTQFRDILINKSIEEFLKRVEEKVKENEKKEQ
jgi:phospholipid transport system substrate-binding protein